jgi:hypothetical protein
MITSLMLLAAIWFSRRLLKWIAARAIVFMTGFWIGWKLMDRG